jgi:hypothetical protein
MKTARTQQQRRRQKATHWWRELHGLSKDTAAGAAAAERGYQHVGELHEDGKDTTTAAAEGYQVVARRPEDGEDSSKHSSRCGRIMC